MDIKIGDTKYYISSGSKIRKGKVERIITTSYEPGDLKTEKKYVVGGAWTLKENELFDSLEEMVEPS